jgi:predicted Ser/Thr protein kinase
VQCLDADNVQALLSGGLAGPARVEAEQHLDTCDECREVVASLIKQTTAEVAPPGAAGKSPAIGVLSTIADRATVPTEAPRGLHAIVELAPGAAVGRYRIKETLGAGGMGVVYRATDPELGRDVAIKLLRGDRAGDEEERRLIREGQALARVSHPNVIAVHDVGTHDGRVFVAMELVDGASLRDWLAQRRSIADVLAVLAAAGRGLAAAHAAGLVHRDFKPDNVLVGRDGRVRVTDFGLARRERAPGPVTSGQIPLRDNQGVDLVLTREGALVGSPAYMAPEQLAGDHVDARSDQFGFCVTLYEALYGTRPFDGKNLFELEENVMKGKTVPPPAGRAVPASLRAIAMRGISVRPGDRFASMDHVIAALGRSRARGLRVIAAIAAALALAAGVGLFGDWLARERQRTFAHAGAIAAAGQLDQSVRLKYEAFKTLADATRGITNVQYIMGNRDQADFGLGSVEDDRAHLQELHDGMVSGEWFELLAKTTGGVFAVSDYKGRLLYTSAAPESWGTDVQVVPAIAQAMQPDVIYAGAIARGNDPALLASGIIGRTAHADWVLLFIRQFNAGRAVQGLFLQVIDAPQLLRDVEVSDETLTAIVAPTGEATDTMPRELVDAALRAAGAQRLGEATYGGATWFVHTSAIGDLGAKDARPVARIAMASPIHADGLFPSARISFAFALAGLLAIAGATFVLSRRSARLLGAVAASADSSVVPAAKHA